MTTPDMETMADGAATAAIRAVWDAIPADKAEVYGRVFDLMTAAKTMYRRLDDGTLVCVDASDAKAEEDAYTRTFEVLAIAAHLKELLAAWGYPTREERVRIIDQIMGWFVKGMGLTRLPPGGAGSVEDYCRSLRRSHRMRANTQTASSAQAD